MLTKEYEANFSEFAQEIAPLVSVAEEQIDDLDPAISMQDIEEVLLAENKDDAIEALLDKKEAEESDGEAPSEETIPNDADPSEPSAQEP